MELPSLVSISSLRLVVSPSGRFHYASLQMYSSLRTDSLRDCATLTLLFLILGIIAKRRKSIVPFQSLVGPPFELFKVVELWNNCIAVENTPIKLIHGLAGVRSHHDVQKESY